VLCVGIGVVFRFCLLLGLTCFLHCSCVFVSRDSDGVFFMYFVVSRVFSVCVACFLSSVWFLLVGPVLRVLIFSSRVLVMFFCGCLLAGFSGVLGFLSVRFVHVLAFVWCCWCCSVIRTVSWLFHFCVGLFGAWAGVLEYGCLLCIVVSVVLVYMGHSFVSGFYFIGSVLRHFPLLSVVASVLAVVVSFFRLLGHMSCLCRSFLVE